MGAKCVYKVVTSATRSAAQSEKELVRRVEAHMGRKLGPWEVSCAALQHAEKKRPSLEVVTTSEVPGHCFVVADGEVTEAEHSFLGLIPKISRFQQRSFRVVKGVEYDFVDFRVRVGRIFDKANPGDVVVEIEYRPCCLVEDCADLIMELMEKFVTPLVPPPDAAKDSEEYKIADVSYRAVRVSADKKYSREKQMFTLKHAAFLYIKLLTAS